MEVQWLLQRTGEDAVFLRNRVSLTTPDRMDNGSEVDIS